LKGLYCILLSLTNTKHKQNVKAAPVKQFCYLWFIPVNRLLGWWSIDEGSREEQARLYSAGDSG